MHGLVWAIPINQIPRRLSGSEVHEGCVGAHDLWVLLRPLGFSNKADEQVRVLLDIISVTEMGVSSVHPCHAVTH